MGFGPSGPRILPAVQDQQEGLAQFASGIESILTKAKEQKDFTQSTDAFNKMLKDRTDPEGNVDLQGLGFDVQASSNIVPSQKTGFQNVVKQGQEQQFQQKKLDFEQKKLDAAEAKLKRDEKPPSDVTKFLEKTNEAGTKAQTGIGLLDQIDQVLETGSGGLGGILPISNPVTGRIQDVTGLKSGDQRLLENLSFQLVTNAFPTLPRIKSEFDRLLLSNPSIVNTVSGNKKITSAIRKSFELATEKQALLDELREKGVPEKQLEREVNRRFTDKENAFEKQTLADFRNLKDSSEIESIDQILRERGEL